MLLDLFITHWTEDWETGEKGLRMLSLQRLVDWKDVRVTIVHDGSAKFPEVCFAGFPFKVHQVCLEHGGIAKARNWCIQHSDAEWIRWCDFDDMFANVHALRDMMHVLNNNEYDLIWHELLAEVDGIVHIKRDRDPVFIHNKVFRRQFLLDHQIYFPEHLTWCEDSAMLALVEMEIDHERIGKIKATAPLYVYIAREGSLCNRPEIKFKNLMSFFDRHCFVAEEFLKRGLIDQYRTMCVRVMADSYYTLKRAPGIAEDKSEHEKRVWRWFEDHRDDFFLCRPEMVDLVMKAVNRERNDGGPITAEDMMDWINKHERGE